jgi:hypothetical protein
LANLLYKTSSVDPYPIGNADPDPDPGGLNMTDKNIKREEISYFPVLNVPFTGLFRTSSWRPSKTISISDNKNYIFSAVKCNPL